jgi:SAM-dependent methyltransferase
VTVRRYVVFTAALHNDAVPDRPRSAQVLTDEQRAKENARPDSAFYQQPRFVHHVDGRFRERLTALYRDRLAPGCTVLDLMSSWVSHLPEDPEFGHVEGHGLNDEELAANPRLDHFFVQDLNADPVLPLSDLPEGEEAYDAVLCAVSVQYLQYPERVFAEVARALRPGGTFIVSFSNRMFAQKAIRAWREASGPERCRLVARLMDATGAFTAPETITHVPDVPPTQRFLGNAPDPFYAVCARRTGDPVEA